MFQDVNRTQQKNFLFKADEKKSHRLSNTVQQTTKTKVLHLAVQQVNNGMAETTKMPALDSSNHATPRESVGVPLPSRTSTGFTEPLPNNEKKRQWFSGKIHRCHRWAPRSIRG